MTRMLLNSNHYWLDTYLGIQRSIALVPKKLNKKSVFSSIANVMDIGITTWFEKSRTIGKMEECASYIGAKPNEDMFHYHIHAGICILETLAY